MKEVDETCAGYQPCHQNKYTFTELRYIAQEQNETLFMFSLNYKDKSIEVHKSFISYKFQNFIAEFGGLVGMFLGVSTFSLIGNLSEFYIKLSD